MVLYRSLNALTLATMLRVLAPLLVAPVIAYAASLGGVGGGLGGGLGGLGGGTGSSSSGIGSVSGGAAPTGGNASAGNRDLESPWSLLRGPPAWTSSHLRRGHLVHRLAARPSPRRRPPTASFEGELHDVLVKIPNFNEGSATSGRVTDSPLEIPRSDLDPDGVERSSSKRSPGTL
jgi:hypothetical protein